MSIIRKIIATLDPRGRELPDPTPVGIPVGLKRPPTLQEQIKAMVRTQLSQQMQQQGYETFEEAEDFDVDDDFDPKSPWEHDFDAEAKVKEYNSYEKHKKSKKAPDTKSVEKPKTDPA